MKPLVSRWVRIRIALVAMVYLAGLLLIIVRGFYLQVLDRDYLVERAERQHKVKIQIAPKRGAIYDRQMQEIAVSVEVDSIYARPSELESLPRAAKKLAPVLGLDERRLLKKLQGESPFIWVKRRTTPSEATAVRALNLAGIGFIKEGRRYYPHRSLAAKVLGFVGMDGEGLEGIELHYDKVLRGEKVSVRATRDGRRQAIMLEGTGTGEAKEGRGIVLTIDHAIQYITETELAAAVQKARAKRGIAIVMEPRTGHVLALAEFPSFNPNLYAEAPAENRRCWSLSTAFEPGSIFKVFVVAAALEAGVVGLRDRVFCEHGAYRFGGHTIHDVHAYGWLNVAEVVKHSSNIGALKIAERLGSERLYRYIRSFGFGEPSGADFPGDPPGLLPALRLWKQITRGTIAFGQGIAVTPIQMTSAVAAIANGGLLMRPRLVASEVDPKGQVVERYEPHTVRRVISTETAGRVTAFMEGVTEPGGTGEAARVAGYAVAGKTGTAQKAKVGARGYSSKRIGSFIGFVPAGDPRLAISVIIDEPRGIPYGGRVAAPAFRKIAEKSLTYLGIPPLPTAPGLRPPVYEAKGRYEVRRGGPGRGKAEGRVRTPSLASRQGESRPAVKTVALEPRMPDFEGLSMRGALHLAESHNLEIRVEGSGFAVSQSPKPGARLKAETAVKVRFAPPGDS
jgi:cell division protein FtsI (penicillin-binding protein 3)